jgi:NADH-quinone oxidoreductase subunit L
MGGVWKKIPCTYVLMLIGTLALTGFPFLSGFYSKDAIIEFALFKNSTIGNYAASIGIFTAFLTSIYSWRLLFKTFHGTYNNKKFPIEKAHESPLIMLIPIILLSIGAIFAGYFFKETFIGHDSNEFWSNSILFLKEFEHTHLPIYLIIITPVIVILAIPISYYYFVKNKSILEEFKKTNSPLYNFLIKKWYIDELYDLILVNPLKKIGYFFWKKGDQNTIDRYGPDGISKIIKLISDKAVQFQSGYIYDYAFVMLIGLSALITYLILN